MNIREIKQVLIDSGMDTKGAVAYMASLVNRSEASVYRWLSKGRKAPEHVEELLALKISAPSSE